MTVYHIVVPKKSVQLAIRLPAPMVEELDRAAAYFSGVEALEVRITRSHVARHLIRLGLDQLQTQTATTRRRKVG